VTGCCFRCRARSRQHSALAVVFLDCLVAWDSGATGVLNLSAPAELSMLARLRPIS
jgi:hypothetical protein